MKKEVAEKWIEALTSGKYKQGKGQLRNSNDEYCCLGVLCDLYRKETGDGEWADSHKNYQSVFFDGSPYSLPEKVIDWAEMKSKSGVYSEVDHKWLVFKKTTMNNLSNINDEGKSFEQIAGIIEENMEAL